MALGLLLESLLGEGFSVLLFIMVAALSIGLRVGSPVLLITITITLAANVYVFPAMLKGSASGSVVWTWLPVWCLEGLLVNWLLVVLSRGTRDQSAALHANPSLSGVSHTEPSTLRLLMDSSTGSQEQVRLMIESIGDYAIVMLGPEGGVASWNIGAERILGYQASEILGVNHSKFYSEDDKGLKSPQHSLHTAETEGKFEVEGWRRRKDDSQFWAHVGVTPMRSATGDLLGFAMVIRDITEKKRAEESLRQAHEELEIRVRDRTAQLAEANQALQAEVLGRQVVQEVLRKRSTVLRSILDSIGDAIIVAESGEPLTFNPAAGELFGIGPGPLTIGEWFALGVLNTVDSTDLSIPITATEGPMSLALRGEEVVDLELVVQFPGSRKVRWVLANARPLRNPSGGSSGAVVIFHEITERRRHDQELKAARDSAEAASRAKDQFLATLSHELRTPLTPVLLAASDLLAKDDLEPEVRSTLSMILRNAEIESRLIDDLLDLTRATTGRLTLSLNAVDLHDVIKQAAQICRPELQNSQLELRLDLDAARHHLDGDAARLQQIFWNLIKNAVKFTPEDGRITIRTWNLPGLDSGRSSIRLLAEVSDTGIGIEPERLAGIFNAFEHRDPEHHRVYGGLGLGLAISRSIAEAHGGRLTAFSAGKDRGTVFTIEFNVAGCAFSGVMEDNLGPELDGIPPDGIAGESPSADLNGCPAPEGLRILLVDDNHDTLHYLAGLLQRHGHSVNPASNFSTATKLAEANAYDLLISDIELPDGSGLDIIRDLRRNHPTPGIALSGFGTVDDVVLSLEAGFAEHLTKPIDVRKLEAAIARVAK